MSQQTGKKPMATVAAPSIEMQFRYALTSALSQIPAVRSAHVYHSERAISVWVDIAEDKDSVRRSIYDIEDGLSDTFRHALIDFHLIPVPAGRKIEEFVTADCVYARHA